MAMDDCLDLESDPQLVTAAREFVRTRLAAWEITEQLDAAVLVASELVTNAILHARTALQLRVSVGDEGLRVEVYDENPRVPTMGPCPPDATSGRGLALVAQLSAGWGIEHRAAGKVVWATLGPVTLHDEDSCVDLTGVTNVDDALSEVRQTRPDPDPSAA